MTCLLTPWCRVLLEQLTGLQLVKKFPAFHGSLPHSQASATCLYSIMGQPNPIHITTSHLLEIHSNIIHPSTPRSDPLRLLYLIEEVSPKTSTFNSILLLLLASYNLTVFIPCHKGNALHNNHRFLRYINL